MCMLIYLYNKMFHILNRFFSCIHNLKCVTHNFNEYNKAKSEPRFENNKNNTKNYKNNINAEIYKGMQSSTFTTED